LDNATRKLALNRNLLFSSSWWWGWRYHAVFRSVVTGCECSADSNRSRNITESICYHYYHHHDMKVTIAIHRNSNIYIHISLLP
jgi:hypothetical protein